MKIIIKNNRFKELDEKIVLLSIIGSLESIKYCGMTIDEAEKFLFSPHMINELNNKKCNRRVIELIEKGCELEDFASLIPEKFVETIDEIKKDAILLLKEYEGFDGEFWLDS